MPNRNTKVSRWGWIRWLWSNQQAQNTGTPLESNEAVNNKTPNPFLRTVNVSEETSLIRREVASETDKRFPAEKVPQIDLSRRIIVKRRIREQNENSDGDTIADVLRRRLSKEARNRKNLRRQQQTTKRRSRIQEDSTSSGSNEQTPTSTLGQSARIDAPSTDTTSRSPTGRYERLRSTRLRKPIALNTADNAIEVSSESSSSVEDKDHETEG